MGPSPAGVFGGMPPWVEGAGPDENAARNVKARLSDPEIDRWTPYQKVKSILLSRTERFRLGLLNQDPSCAPQGPSTGSESPEQLCLSF